MANYGYIKIRVGAPGASKVRRIESFEAVLKQCVLKALDDRWQVKLADFEDEGPTWIVSLAGTAVPDNGKYACTDDGRPFDQDIGFAVALQTRAIAFRHGLSMFEGWAQGRIEEQLSEYYGHGIFYDATDRTTKPGPREYRKGKTFFDYLTRNFTKPLSPEDREHIDRFKRGVPEGHWGE